MFQVKRQCLFSRADLYTYRPIISHVGLIKIIFDVNKVHYHTISRVTSHKHIFCSTGCLFVDMCQRRHSWDFPIRHSWSLFLASTVFRRQTSLTTACIGERLGFEIVSCYQAIYLCAGPIILVLYNLSKVFMVLNGISFLHQFLFTKERCLLPV